MHLLRLTPAIAVISFLIGDSAGQARADANPSGRGPAISAGFGHEYAGLGLQAHYFLPVAGTRWSWAPSLAVGLVPSQFAAEWILEGANTRVAGFAAGVSGSYGYRHRISGSLGYGLVGALGLPVQGIFVDAEAVYGASALAGYEYVGASGLLVRIRPLGLAYWTHPLAGPGERWYWAGSVGLGWKLW
jgi:hypothetical protein